MKSKEEIILPCETVPSAMIVLLPSEQEAKCVLNYVSERVPCNLTCFVGMALMLSEC
jgi:hypothetical protein